MSEKVCIVGAGSSGIAACQVLKARGIPFDCFEMGSDVGGNWRYENDNGLSSAYRSLHINSGRRIMSYRAYPMPDHLPDYPDHFQIARYFDDYVDHFGLREQITFNTEVKRIGPADGGWEVTVEDGDGAATTHRYRAVLVANGHHWDPRWPEPPFPGSDEFSGEQIHVHHYREPDVLVGKRVLVLGIGNSAVDVAVESSRIADATFLAMRRGAHVLPKFLSGKPIDEVSPPWTTRLPLSLRRVFMSRMLNMTVGDVTDYGLPKPDHKLLEAHPTVSSELLPRLGHGDITVKPNIERFGGGRTVRFVDGSEEEIDLVVYCTGYRITFPFLPSDIFEARDNRMPLYRRVVSVENPGLYFIGFIQPLGPIMPIAEAQSEWVADLLARSAQLPAEAEMRAEIADHDERMRKRFVASKRHTIEVDFHPYLRQIRRERRRSAQAA
jgi:dimethylaniline monooxygenase (N-oxide forming)